MQRSVTACVGAALVVGLTLGTISSAQASVADGKSAEEFCEKALAISKIVPESTDDAALIDAARGYVKEYKKLAKLATTKELPPPSRRSPSTTSTWLRAETRAPRKRTTPTPRSKRP